MEKIINMRSLAGLVNRQGQMICQGKLFRSGNPSVANKADCNELKTLALDEIIDFRSNQEKHSSEGLFARQFNWVAQPIFIGDISAFVLDSLNKQDTIASMCEMYKRFPREFQSPFRYFLKQAEQGKTLLFHCTAGKDRTGFASLLLLSALGMTEDAIMEDYLLSNKATQALKQQMATLVMTDSINEEALMALLAVFPQYLESTIAVINKDYGGLQQYLIDTLAIDVNAIRSHYLER